MLGTWECWGLSQGVLCLFTCEKLTRGYCPDWETLFCSEVLLGTRAKCPPLVPVSNVWLHSKAVTCSVAPAPSVGHQAVREAGHKPYLSYGALGTVVFLI